MGNNDHGRFIGQTLYSSDGDKIGKIGQVYFDDDTDQPKWITVNTGLFGMSESFVPLQGAQFDGDRVTLAYDQGHVKDAPNVDDDGHLDVEEEQQLYRHYGLTTAAVSQATGPGATSGATTARPGRRRRHPARPGRPDRGPRHLRPDHRRRDDPLRGAPAGRAPKPRKPGGRGCASTW